MTAGFGLEKLGIVSLRYPWLCLLAVALITPLMAYGAKNLEFSSDVREIFRSNDPAFAQLDQIDEYFPASRGEIEVVVISETTFTVEQFKTLKQLDLSLKSLAGIQRVLSMFSAVQSLGEGEEIELEPLFPEDLSKLDSWEDLRAQAVRNPLIIDKLLSNDGSLAVLVITLAEQERSVETERALVNSVQAKAEEVLAGTGLEFRLTGLSAMRIEIVSALARDQETFRTLALIVGLFLCWIFLRNLALVAIAGIPAAVALMWLLGSMWLAGQDINLLTGIAPSLVLVIVFSDCLHLLFSIRNEIWKGSSLEEAIELSVHRVGPACVLTSLTTTLALASLLFVPHPFISDFGLTAAWGTALALFMTLLLVPALSVLLLRRFARRATGKPRADIVSRGIDAVCHAAADAVSTRPRTISALGVLLVLAGGWLHALNEPRYSYASNLPTGHSALDALEAVDTRMAGVNTLQVIIDWPAGYHLMSFNTLKVIRQVHDILAREPALGAITSVRTIEDWLGNGEDAEFRLLDFLEKAQESSLVSRLAAPDENAVLVTAQFGQLTSDQLRPILDRLERRLSVLEGEGPEVEIAVTGMVPISARASHDMIRALNRSLMLAIGLILVLIALAMRSVSAGIVSILPNLFPIAVGGAYLQLVGSGLQFTSLIAFTIGFGIAVDSTIHVLNRYRLERSDSNDDDVAAALRRTLMKVGPVVIMSTIVLAAGLGTSLMSTLPMVHLYGVIVVIVLLSATIGALLFLPALTATIEGWRRSAKPSAP